MVQKNGSPDIFDEIRRNLLGSLEVALFMPVARQRFGDTRAEAIRSFAVPVLMFPLIMFLLSMSPHGSMGDQSANIASLVYGLRLVLVWAVFFGAVYWIAREIDRKKHFYQFVIASNWLAVPATAILIPVGVMLMTGSYSWAELYPFITCLLLYTYGFTAFMAAKVLRVPWEMAGFIVFVSMCINDSTLEIVYWVGGQL